MDRPIRTDALETLGTIITSAEKRDAIHLAVEPVIAGAGLEPGQHITVRNGVASAAPVGRGLGIVDPFLAEGPEEGDRFWMVLYPRTIQSLRHVWTHPALSDEALPEARPKAPLERDQAAMARISQLAADHHISAEELLAGAETFLATGESLHFGFDLDYRNIDPFWRDYERVTGHYVPEDKRVYFFRCSC